LRNPPWISSDASFYYNWKFTEASHWSRACSLGSQTKIPFPLMEKAIFLRNSALGGTAAGRSDYSFQFFAEVNSGELKIYTKTSLSGF
jgi:hypothetical protein